MIRVHGRSSDPGDAGGFALLVLMVGLTALAGLVAVLLPAVAPPRAALRGRAESRLAVIRSALESTWLRTGSFAADLRTLGARAGFDPTGSWRIDPFGDGAEFRYRRAGRPITVTVTSRGDDGRFGTRDDAAFSFADQVPGRRRTMDQLRLLRATIIAWQAAAGPAPMSPADRAELIAATNDYAIALRSRFGASPAARAALDARRADCLQTIRAVRSRCGVVLPRRVTGSGGLMTAIGWPDARAVDAWSRRLVWDEAVGAVSRGGDTGSNDDDL